MMPPIASGDHRPDHRGQPAHAICRPVLLRTGVGSNLQSRHGSLQSSMNRAGSDRRSPTGVEKVEAAAARGSNNGDQLKRTGGPQTLRVWGPPVASLHCLNCACANCYLNCVLPNGALPISWPASGIDSGQRGGVVLAGDPVGQLLPLGAGADGGRHQVGGVERDTAFGSCRMSTRELVDRVLDVRIVRPLLAEMRDSSLLRLVVRPVRGGQVPLERLHLGWLENAVVELAGDLDRLAELCRPCRLVEGEDVAGRGDRRVCP